MSFETKSVAELEAMSSEDLQSYFEAKKAFDLEKENGKSMSSLETKAAVAGLEKKTADLEATNLELKSKLETLDKELVELKKAPVAKKNVNPIVAALETKSEEIVKLRSSQGASIRFETKLQDHTDIENTSDFADMRAGIIDQPKRLNRVQALFPKVKISKDVYKYVEQTAVIRDGRNVAYNSSFTPNTEETITVSSIEPKIVKALMDVSTDLIKDFAYMQGRSEKLVNESVSYKVEQDLIQGDGQGDNISGLLQYAGEFDATDTVNSGTPIHAPVSGIPTPTLIDLILSMDMQIDVHGEEHDYNATSVVMHRSDWFKRGGQIKDTTGRYLDERVQRNGRDILIDGKLKVTTTNNMPAGTIVVMDPSKAELVDRDTLTVEIAYQNGTKWEQEIATMKGYVRLNLLVPNQNVGAFQKCTDIDSALSDIG